MDFNNQAETKKTTLILTVMKKLIKLSIIFLLFFYCNTASSESTEPVKSSSGNSILIFSSPDLFGLATTWANEYSKANPGISISISNYAEASESARLNPGENLYFLSEEYLSTLSNENLWTMVVGRDAIVPVFNAKNPYLDAISQQGISPEKLTRLVTTATPDWNTLLSNGQKNPVTFYLLNNAAVETGVGNFLKTELSGPAIRKAESSADIIGAITADPYAIGFCKLADIIDENNLSINENIKILPIDKNANGKLDYNERIYDKLDAFLRGIWIGKYPKALNGNIYAVASAKPDNGTEVAFLKWVLSTGQQFLTSNGYCDLVYSDRQAKTDMLTDNSANISNATDYSALKIILMVLLAFVAASLLIVGTTRYFSRNKSELFIAASSSSAIFDENSVEVPKGVYFDKSHTWAFMEKTGEVKIGIDDFLQHVTGTLTRVIMKNPGEKIVKGETLITIIREGKQLNINSPVSGTIKTKNEKLSINSAIINSSPFGEGWIYSVEPLNWLRDTQFLIMADQYKMWLKNEFSRLKDFLAHALNPNTPEYSYVVLQDGGELKNNVLSDLGPTVWEDFQTQFIDSSRHNTECL